MTDDELGRHLEEQRGDIEENSSLLNGLTDKVVDLARRQDELEDRVSDVKEEPGSYLNISDIDVDFSGIEGAVRYIGGGIGRIEGGVKSLPGKAAGVFKTEDENGEVEWDRRKVGLGAIALVAGATYDAANIRGKDGHGGSGLIGAECGPDIDGAGHFGEQTECDYDGWFNFKSPDSDPTTAIPETDSDSPKDVPTVSETKTTTETPGLDEDDLHSIDGSNYISGSALGGHEETVENILDHYETPRLEELAEEVDSYEVRISETGRVEVIQDGTILYEEVLERGGHNAFTDAYHDAVIDGDTDVQ